MLILKIYNLSSDATEPEIMNTLFKEHQIHNQQVH